MHGTASRDIISDKLPYLKLLSGHYGSASKTTRTQNLIYPFCCGMSSDLFTHNRYFPINRKMLFLDPYFWTPLNKFPKIIPELPVVVWHFVIPFNYCLLLFEQPSFCVMTLSGTIPLTSCTLISLILTLLSMYNSGNEISTDDSIKHTVVNIQ